MQASPPDGPPCRQPGFPETSSFLHPEKTMPLWKIYHPENAFSDEDKQAIAQRITAVYCDLPRFYVGVVFEAVARTSFFIGGEPADDFVRISVDHIARQIRDEETKTRFLRSEEHTSELQSPC